MKDQKYITPTKKSPIFTAVNDHFGYIERSLYKETCIRNSVCSTFALCYSDAVNELHDWIKDHPWVIEDYPKSKFIIYMKDGSWNERHDYAKEVKVYQISASKAKKYLL